MHALPSLELHLRTLGRVVLGYSGGVDSALLALACRRALGREGFVAVIGRSASYPAVQYASAIAIATRFDLPLREVETRELEDTRYRANPTNRCYFCKSELWRVLGQIAAESRADTIIDGTNADDLAEHRPGLRAATEGQVRSPLAELGWTKAMVREAAAALGLPTWDAPASPCLSSRIQYGLEVTPERLRQVERAEQLLRDHGVTGDLRVRHHGAHASVELLPHAQQHLAGAWEEICRELEAVGFASVTLDPRGYRRGGLLADLPVLPG
jgi:uncharacterized protein